MRDTASASLGEWLKQRRKELDLTQQSLAYLVGCSPDLVRKVETGVRRPSRQVAELLAEALEIGPDERAAFVNWMRTGSPHRPQAPTLLDGARPEHAAEVPPAEVVNPYKGLYAYGEEDAPYFFGREATVKKLLARLAEPGRLSRFLAVVGPSGIGKSSLVHAGLVPTLRSAGLPGAERFVVATMLPGVQPYEELRAALLRACGKTRFASYPSAHEPGNLDAQLVVAAEAAQTSIAQAIDRALSPDGDSDEHLLLVIDQFEEIFTLTRDDTTRAAFLGNIYEVVTDPAAHTWVVVTLRADFYDRPLLYAGMSELFSERTEVVGVMSPNELYRAIAGPAGQAGLVLEDGLASMIERDIAEQPGALPLLQYALTELFERRTGRTLTLRSYQESGGVLRALGTRAEAIYLDLAQAEREEARQLFLRLVALGEGGEESRRRVPRTELASAARDEEALDQALERFGRYRLLTFDRDPVARAPTVEVAHEALIRVWLRFREWLEDSRGRLRVHRQLISASQEWLANNRDPGFLASGARLAQFEALANENQSTPGAIALAPDERSYVEAGVQQRERERAARERLRRRITAGLAAGLLVTLVLAALAVAQSIQANNERDVALGEAHARATAEVMAADRQKEAEAQQKIAFSRELAARASALSTTNSRLSLLLAIEAAKASETEQADSTLRQLLLATAPRTVLRSEGGIAGVAFSPDGKRIATASLANDARIWDAASGRLEVELPGGKQIGARSSLGVSHVSLAFSPDGKRLAMANTDDPDYVVRVWDLGSGTVLVQLRGHLDVISGVGFSPDGARIVTSSWDGTARVWNASSGALIAELRGHEHQVTSAKFSPDGRQIVTAGYDNTARMWDAATGRETTRLVGHADVVEAASFSPDGERIVTAGRDNTARLWNAKSGEQVAQLRGHTGWVNSAAFSPDGKWVLTVSQDDTARMWDADTGKGVSQATLRDIGVVLPGGQPSTGMFSPDGKTVLIAKLGMTNGSEAWIYPWEFFAPFDTLVAFAPSTATRQLTCQERQEYLHEVGGCGTPEPAQTP